MFFNKEFNWCCIFGIISYLDVGKIIFMEKLLFFGGVIQVVGVVKLNKIKCSVMFDFMEIEWQWGILVVIFVMAFEYCNFKINIFDIFGYQDFQEDIYCIFIVVDSVIVVIDVAKGVEVQIEKLVNVCCMCNILIIVFINKLDCEGFDGFDFFDELE